MILFRVGGSTFAIAASAVDEIRNIQGLKPSPVAEGTTDGMVRHTLVRNGRRYFVVDATVYLQMLPARATRLLVLRNAPVALLVGEIDRMVEIGTMHLLPKAFRGAERNWYRGLAVLATGRVVEVVPVVNPDTLVSKSQVQALSALAAGAEVNG